MAPVLGYWDGRGRAEHIRMLLHYVGVEFEDKRLHVSSDLDRSGWMEIKPTLGLDFPNLPYYIDDDVKMSQSIAILRYVARKHDLAWKDESEQWQLDMLEQQMVDLLEPVSAGPILFSGKSVEEYKEEYSKIAPANIKKVADYLGEKKWLLGDRLSYVDFICYEALYNHKVLLPNIFDLHSNLQTYVARFEELKGVKEYIASAACHPPFWTNQSFPASYKLAMSPPVLGYWNVRALGEPIFLLLHHVGVDFEEKRYKLLLPKFDKSDWLKEKFSLGLEFPNLPYYIDGDVKITQSKAILRYLASKHDLAGKNETEQWKLDMLEQQMSDLAYNVSARPILFARKTVDEYREGYAKTAPTNIKQVADYLGDKKWLLGDRL
ncbi:GSTM3, partial [Cordylochernes scorpioides]